MIKSSIHFFKKWFLPLPSHDDLFPEQEDDRDEDDTDMLPEPEPALAQDTAAAADASMPSKEESEAFKKGIFADDDEPEFDTGIRPEPLNLHEEDFSELVKAPEGSEERVGRSFRSAVQVEPAAEAMADSSDQEDDDPTSYYPA